MIKEYFLKSYYFTVLNIQMVKTYLKIQIKVPIYVYKNYYKYLLHYKYSINLLSINSKKYNTYYKILILSIKI